MSQNNDLKYRYYGARGHVGSLNEREMSFWKAESGSTSTTYNDIRRDYLRYVTGRTGHVNDVWGYYLQQLGYEGSLSDKERQYFSEEPPVVTNVLLLENGTPLLLENGGYLELET